MSTNPSSPPPAPTHAGEQAGEAKCPCQIASEPCHPLCSCVQPISSLGCACCARYGDDEQRLKAAEFVVQSIKHLREWNLNSSLENWFPYTAEELASLRTQLADLRQKLGESEWVSVEDRLPEKEGHYIVSWKSGEVCPASFGLYGGASLTWSKLRFVDQITHWRPLPEPPTQLRAILQKGKQV